MHDYPRVSPGIIQKYTFMYYNFYSMRKTPIYENECLFLQYIIGGELSPTAVDISSNIGWIRLINSWFIVLKNLRLSQAYMTIVVDIVLV